MKPMQSNLTTLSKSASKKEPQTKPTTVTPEKYSSRGADDSLPVYWHQASRMLKDNPSLMTTNVLIAALRQQPDRDTLEFMLTINPKSANIPKEGPTPLQIAIQHDCSCEVISILVKACPIALCRTNPGFEWDPLSYAKHRLRDNKELLELLKKPLGHWMEVRKSGPLQDSANVTPSAAVVVESKQTAVDHQEFSNVKILCARLLKGHKKLNQQLTICQNQIQASECNKSDILEIVDQKQRTQFRHQLIALDMKEKLMLSHWQKIKEHVTKYSETMAKASAEEIRTWKASVESRMNEWELLLEQEAKLNEYVRNDIFEWVEDQEKRRASFTSGEIKEVDVVDVRPRKFCKPWNRLDSS